MALEENKKYLPRGPRKPPEEIDWVYLFREVFDHINGSIFVIDEYANILYCNDISADMMTRPKEEVLHMSMQDILEKGLAEESGGMRAFLAGKPIDTYFHNSRGEGMLVHSVPLRDKDGRIAYAATYSWYEKSMREFWEYAVADSRLGADVLSFLNQYSENSVDDVSSKNDKMRQVYTFARKVARTDGTVLILGESGVGKEVLARYIHRHSLRADKVFIPVNCAAIPENLIESELFGYAKGAFTGALKEGKAGLFEMANGGTLFLDEIGELPLEVQSKLLRVLENGEVRRVGSDTLFYTNARIVAATNRDLKEMVREGTFRKDLFYRLNIVPLYIPPLRERREDIRDLAELFLKEFNNKYHSAKCFSDAAKKALVSYSWPGNIRELKNVIERTVIINREDGYLEISDDGIFLSSHLLPPPQKMD